MTISVGTNQDATKITIAGGGIAGLYAAYLLAQDNQYQIEVLEQDPKHLGGKIATQRIPLPDRRGEYFVAEFGPMRFELDLQQRFRRLAQHLCIGFVPFTPTASPKILTEYEMTSIGNPTSVDDSRVESNET